MTLLGKLQNLSIQFGMKTIVKDVTMDIHSGGCIGIVGANGEGKSTLLSVLANEMEPSKGFIQWYGGIPSMHYFKQQVTEVQELSLAQKSGLPKWHIPKGRAYELMSGGEQMKQRLVEAFSNKVQLLLLDEPTNHLDQQSLQELIVQVKRYKGTVLVVSHDRHFLDEVADSIWEIEHQGVKAYEGNYSVFRHHKEEQRKAQAHLYEVQQKKIARIDEQISELQNWSAKAHSQSTKQEGFKEYHRVKAKRMDSQVRSKRKRLEGEKAKAELNRPTEEKKVSFSIEANRKQGNRVIESRCVTKTFGSHTLWKDASFTIKQGERVALVGPNGCGKTTWLRMLMEEEPYEGELWKTNAKRIGYLRQSIDDLPEEKSPDEWFAPRDFDSRGLIQTLMTNLGFGKEHWHLPIGLMSMGERLKLKLMAFMLEQKDVLLLDEPTNHLDLPSREQLEQTLEMYSGTIIFVTHDRYFLEKIATKLLVFEKGSMKKIDMSYKEWQNRQVETAQQQQLLMLETERQAILGEISFIPKHDVRYDALDQRFNELTVQIKALKE
ncbi:ATP-binding cassette domain-containing protein [Paenisporosarcina quisquiliarum]|uniref:ATP-binding cassette domain-containing protein n=1 Tax=Paenisporosarcina quisquiliarum TaxID=365346 RepID=A0A9X3LGX5_9BACL|nr:ABC-F family ATP-binding cassette domain-containing protein [Paenisporosarcina quisquiliarum]MCZ8536781.1 ATP-binding cassette domain-containing protein [Paenisporosarcina quisquiliarum]